jgi:hypothetical protein
MLENVDLAAGLPLGDSPRFTPFLGEMCAECARSPSTPARCSRCSRFIHTPDRESLTRKMSGVRVPLRPLWNRYSVRICGDSAPAAKTTAGCSPKSAGCSRANARGHTASLLIPLHPLTPLDAFAWLRRQRVAGRSGTAASRSIQCDAWHRRRIPLVRDCTCASRCCQALDCHRRHRIGPGVRSSLLALRECQPSTCGREVERRQGRGPSRRSRGSPMQQLSQRR